MDAAAAQPAADRTAVIERPPEILGDVFAWNKLFRTDFWRDAGLSWPEGVRYEDQPTTTRAYLAPGGSTCVPDVVYHWRIRDDGTSITQQRSSVDDLRDRWATKRMSLRSVEEYVAAKVTCRSSSTGCSPATCTATSPRSPAAPTSGGSCSAPASSRSGATGR